MKATTKQRHQRRNATSRVLTAEPLRTSSTPKLTISLPGLNTKFNIFFDDVVMRRAAQGMAIVFAVLFVVAAFATISGTALMSTSLLTSSAPTTIEEPKYFRIEDKLGRSGYLAQLTRVDSSPETMEIAAFLKETAGAVLAGVYYCPHCLKQKQILGKQVQSSLIPYLECSPEGYGVQLDHCERYGVVEYPTWIFKKLPGQPTITGVKTMHELAEFVRSHLPPSSLPNIPATGSTGSL